HATSASCCHGGAASDKRARSGHRLARRRSELKVYDRTKPTMSLTAFMVSAAILRARAEPSARIASMVTGSRSSRFISPAIGLSLATDRSTSADLKVENCALPYWPSTLARVV